MLGLVVTVAVGAPCLGHFDDRNRGQRCGCWKMPDYV
jgi:hypothetical protein